MFTRWLVILKSYKIYISNVIQVRCLERDLSKLKSINSEERRNLTYDPQAVGGSTVQCTQTGEALIETPVTYVSGKSGRTFQFQKRIHASSCQHKTTSNGPTNVQSASKTNTFWKTTYHRQDINMKKKAYSKFYKKSRKQFLHKHSGTDYYLFLKTVQKC